MPTYAYACTACGHEFDAQQSFTDDALTDCPECTGRLRKKFGAVGVVFKGSGFYRTDSRSGSKGSGSGSTGSSDAASGSSADSGSSTGAAAASSDGGSSGSGSSGNGSSAGSTSGASSSTTSSGSSAA